MPASAQRAQADRPAADPAAALRPDQPVSGFRRISEAIDDRQRPTRASHPNIVSWATASSSARLAPSRAWSDMPFCTVST